MTLSNRLWLLAGLGAVCVFLAPASTVRADGFIYVPDGHVVIPHPMPRHRRIVRPRPRNFPMRVTKHRVTVDVQDTVVKTRVEETFYNPNGVQLEGVYMFPLPPGAAVSGFQMTMGGKFQQGEVLEKDKARQIYSDIVRRVKDPGLLEYVDRGLFRASVFPIPPRGGVDIIIEYSETVARNSGVAEYRYPLDTGKYSTGPYEDVVIDVRMKQSASLRSIQSPSHAVAVARPGPKEARVTFEAKTLNADEDFVLVWNVSEDALAPVLLTHRSHEKDGFFHLSLTPRPERPKEVPPKDVVFVIDTSGSMLGHKMKQVQNALRYCLGGLNAKDRFNIVDFSTEARRFNDGLVDVSDDNRKRAGLYVDQMAARGGTNLEEGVRFALQSLTDGGRLQLVVLLTDGEPTIGVTRPEDVLASIRKQNTAKRRVFVFAVGEDLNAKLLDQFVKEQRGAAQYVRDDENIEMRLSSFYDKIDSPVLTGIRVEFPGQKVSDVYPKPLPDLFRGEELVLVGRYGDDGHKNVIVRGKFVGSERVFEYSLEFGGAAAASTQPHIARLWATRKVGYLLEQIRLSGESKELTDEVIRLSKLHGIITPYTSYLIIEENEIARRLGRPRAEPAATAAPAEALLGGRPGGAGASRARQRAAEEKRGFDAAKGRGAVKKSRSIARLKDARTGSAADADGAEFLEELDRAAAGAEATNGERGSGSSGVAAVDRIRRVAGKTFYLQKTRWVDAALTALKTGTPTTTVQVKYLSDDYFALLTKHAGIGKLLGLGAEVTFLWKGQKIVIN